jgi:hypothetical protein
MWLGTQSCWGWGDAGTEDKAGTALVRGRAVTAGISQKGPRAELGAFDECGGDDG